MGDAGRRRRRLDLSSSYPSPPPPFPPHSDRRMWGPFSPRRPHQTPFADPPCIPDDRRGFQLLLLLFVTHLEMEWGEMKIAAVFPPPGSRPLLHLHGAGGEALSLLHRKAQGKRGNDVQPSTSQSPYLHTKGTTRHRDFSFFILCSHTFSPTAVLGRRCDRKASNIRSLVRGKTEIEEAPLYFHLTEAKNPDGIFFHSYFQT